MTGALLGLMVGIGVLLMWRGSDKPAARGAARESSSTAELLAQAGLPGVRPRQLYAMCAGAAFVVFIVVAGVSHTASIAAAFGGFAAYVPIALVKRRRTHRIAELRTLWPDVVDNLGSGVRAGLSLPEAVAQLAVRGPAPLRPEFERFAVDHRVTGRFGDCLDRLKASLADPVADRIIESLRIARDVGGNDLGRLLRTLSQFLRDDARTRAEIETRQGWTVAAARLALCAPWFVLGALCLRPQTVAAYDSATGVAVLCAGGIVSFLAYRLMLLVAKLPDDVRVLR
jgi:tight adherence protein B